MKYCGFLFLKFDIFALSEGTIFVGDNEELSSRAKYECDSERVRDILSAQEDNILIPVRSCNILYLP